MPLAAAETSRAIPRIDDERLLSTLYAPHHVRMPTRIFTDEVREIIQKGESGPFFSVVHRDPSRGRRWLAIPEGGWTDIIAPHAALTLTKCGGKCPFCGKSLRQVKCDVIKSPLRGRTGCCGHAVFATEDELPNDYRARSNHTETMPHPDGTDYQYRFHVPGSDEMDRRLWFCGAG